MASFRLAIRKKHLILIFYKAFAALLIFLVSIASSFYPVKISRNSSQANKLEIGEALASGIFIGAAFFHMLPNAISIFNHLYPTLTYPLAEIICISGFVLLLFLERLTLTNALFSSTDAIPYILTLILILHSVIEGAALGIGNTFTEAAMLFIAIIAHKGSASFALTMTLLRYQLSWPRILTIIILFSMMTPLGIGLGTLINFFAHSTEGEWIAGIFNAFAAGTFLYISILHHIRFHQCANKSQAMQEFAYLVLGIFAMAVIAKWI